MRSRLDAAGLGDDLAHPLGGAELDALHQRDDRGVARAGRPPSSPRLARSVCDGTARTTMSAPSTASAGSVVAATDARQRRGRGR